MVLDEPSTTPASGARPPEPVRFPIVGIGASAGGLEALEALTKQLVANGMAFVVHQHLAPGHESALTDILGRGAGLPVVTVKGYQVNRVIRDRVFHYALNPDVPPARDVGVGR